MLACWAALIAAAFFLSRVLRPGEREDLDDEA
jgi:hypothetical protein